MATRVIAGTARGRRLKVGHGRSIRPTADRVKEALFDVLASRFDLEGTEVLDLFAGSGGLGIEALSRGAAAVTFVESAGAAARLLQENVALCGLDARARLLRCSAAAALRRLQEDRRSFDGVLLDPPYDAGWVDKTLRLLAEAEIVREGGWVAVEHAATEPVRRSYGRLYLTRERRYGKTALAVFVSAVDAKDTEDTQPDPKK